MKHRFSSVRFGSAAVLGGRQAGRLVPSSARGLGVLMALGVVGVSSGWSSGAAWAITDKEEVAMGESMRAAVEARMGGTLPASDPMSQRVERIGRRFAHLAHPRSFGYRYRVLRSNSILNAFASPGGTIYITTRLVKFSRSDDELASVLGHETAHVSQHHIAQEVDERNAFTRFGTRLSELRRQAAQSSAKGTAKPAKPASKPGASSAASASSSAAVLPTLTWFLLSRGRSRALESEADAVSVRWMKQLGYNPRASISLLQHAASTQPASSSPLNSLLASHPGMPERVVALREQIEHEKLDLPSKYTAHNVSKLKPGASAPVTANPDKAPSTAASDVAAAATAGKAPAAQPTNAPSLP